MNSKQDRLDVYQRITNQIIEAIEQGVDAWQMPWHRHATTPRNALTGKSYRGVNVLSLWATATAFQYRSGIWATYAQWTELGAQVRKGEKSTFIVFWKFHNQDSETEESEEQEPKRAGCIARGYNVFNADQVDGYGLPEFPHSQKPNVSNRLILSSVPSPLIFATEEDARTTTSKTITSRFPRSLPSKRTPPITPPWLMSLFTGQAQRSGLTVI